MKNEIKKPKFWRKNASLKSIRVETKEWFDRVNGNSYGSSRVLINEGLKNEFTFKIPFCYGYGNYQEQKAFEILVSNGVIDKDYKYEHSKFTRIFHKQEKCLKRDVMTWGK